MSAYMNRGGKKPFAGKGGKPMFGAPKSQRAVFGSKMRPARTERLELFKATCSVCGKACEVPFRPSPGKPVYCKECFGSTEGRYGDREAKQSFAAKRQVPESTHTSSMSVGGVDALTTELKAVNQKLERLIRAVEGLLIADDAPETEEVAPPKKVKATVAKKAAKK
jgi:CxxC-x17-CxxC domain-containing protein